MATNPAEQFQIPPEMRAMAEKSVEQAKQAVEGFISAAHRTVSAFDGRNPRSTSSTRMKLRTSSPAAPVAGQLCHREPGGLDGFAPTLLAIDEG